MPVILDAGVGTASDAALAMEAGCDARAAGQRDLARGRPGRDGARHAQGGRGGLRGGARPGRIPRRLYAQASSPEEGLAELEPPVSTELERGALDELAARWRAAWQGAGFESCCTPDVSYEDPVAVDPLRRVDALDRHAAALRARVPRPARRGHRAAARRAASTCASRGARSAPTAATSARCCRRPTAS